MEFFTCYQNQDETFEEVFKRYKVVHVLPKEDLSPDKYYKALAQETGFPLIYEEDPVTGVIRADKWTEIMYVPGNTNDTYKHSNKHQPLHTDYGYFSFEIFASFFYCEEQSGFGGATTFIDVDTIVDILQRVDPGLFSRLLKEKIHFGRKDNPIANNEDYILSKDEIGWKINWNYFRAREDRENAIVIEDFKEFLETYVEKSGELKELKLKPYEAVFFHDRRVLHGRNSFVGNRKLNKGGIAKAVPDAVKKILADLMIELSIVVVTYNHEAYIQKALQSIVDQKLNFGYEVIVADDASSDRTLSIVNDFISDYPDRFILHHHQVNKGILGNVLSIIPLLRGKYFALLDGDDYWDHEQKLQKQIEFLEAHPDFNGVFHDARIIQDHDAEQLLFNKKYLYSQSYCYNEVIFASDIVKRLIIPTSSILFRTKNELLQQVGLINDNFSVAWKLSCIMIKKSKFLYMNQAWSVYRNHINGISKTNKIKFHESHIVFLKNLMRDNFYREYRYDLYTAIVNEYSIILDTKNELTFKMKRQYLRKYVYYEICKILKYRSKVFRDSKAEAK